jgi:hypothetical protein
MAADGSLSDKAGLHCRNGYRPALSGGSVCSGLSPRLCKHWEELKNAFREKIAFFIGGSCKSVTFAAEAIKIKVAFV